MDEFCERLNVMYEIMFMVGTVLLSSLTGVFVIVLLEVFVLTSCKHDLQLKHIWLYDFLTAIKLVILPVTEAAK
jgi:hypothetical protein